MKEEIIRTIFLHIAVTLALIASVFSLSNSYYKKNFTFVKDPAFTQPIISAAGYPWQIRSIDMEKANMRYPSFTREEITNQVRIFKEMGVNYVAISTLYDDNKSISLWADIIHSEGLLVWYKPNWLDWNGSMSTELYLEKTYQFILDNKRIFREGDSFSFATSPETEGVGMGLKFLSWKEYNKFMLEGIFMSQYAFRTIGMEGKIHTNWVTVRSSTAKDHLSPEFVEKAGIVTVEYFGNQSHTRGYSENKTVLINEVEKEFDEIYTKWKKPVIIEWGYQINQKVSGFQQAEVIKEFMERMKSKPYITGINYFTGSVGPSALINTFDAGNTETTEAAGIIRNYFIK